MKKSEQGRAEFLSKGKDARVEPRLRSALMLLNSTFEAARMGRGGETFALRIAEMWGRLVSSELSSHRERL